MDEIVIILKAHGVETDDVKRSSIKELKLLEFTYKGKEWRIIESDKNIFTLIVNDRKIIKTRNFITLVSMIRREMYDIFYRSRL